MRQYLMQPVPAGRMISAPDQGGDLALAFLEHFPKHIAADIAGCPGQQDIFITITRLKINVAVFFVTGAIMLLRCIKPVNTLVGIGL